MDRRRAAAGAVIALVLLVMPGGAIASPQPVDAQGGPAAAAASRFELQVPVLYYHRIKCAPATATDPSLWECPDVFAAQLGYLRDQGWSTLTTDEVADLLAAHQCPPAKKFVISIDDGNVDGYENAAPIMESLGMRGTFFAIAQRKDGTRLGMISFDQLRDLVARGHAVGNHSLTHLSLNRQTTAVLYDQIEGAQQVFDQELGFRPRTFAYPYGRYNDDVIAQVAASGFELAFTVHAGAREASDQPYVAKRILVPNTASGADVLARLAPYADGCRPPTPDVSVARTSAGPFSGNNIYSAKPISSQTVKRSGVAVGHTYGYSVRLENDAQVAGSFRLGVALAGTAGMTVHCYVNGAEITQSLIAGTYTSPVLEPWSGMLMDVSITPTKAGRTGDATKVIVTARSSSYPARVDVGRLVAAF